MLRSDAVAANAPRRSQSERSAAMQRRLILATIKLLKRKGYAGLRTAAIADEAGVSRGGLLHHFASKDELILASAEFIMRRARAHSIRRLRRVQTGQDPFDAIIADARDFFFSDEFGVALDLVLMGGKNPGFRRHIFRYAEENRLPVERAWQELLVQRGLPAADAQCLLDLSLNMVRGLSIRALWQRDEAYVERLLDGWRAMMALYLERQVRPVR